MEQNKILDERASTPEDWEGYYSARGEVLHIPIDYNDFRNMPYKLVFEKIKEYFGGGSVLEVGAGDSDALIEVCKKLAPASCFGLDYVEMACDRLSNKAKSVGVNVDVVCADMFTPPESMLARFDFVMSHGVVEHFHDLPNILRAIGVFAKPGGVIFTLIPNNKKTIYGFLMRKWNKDVYDAHVMYDLHDLMEAHKKAGLEIIWGGHLCSSNFGMLSWCFKDRESGIGYQIYKQLTRFSKLLWFFESKFGLLPATRAFAPSIVVVSRAYA